MRNVVEIARQDLRNLRRVPLVIGLLAGLAVLPALYAWFNVGAAWDPYANTGEVSVAVVNADEGATVDGQAVHLGDDLEAELRDNDELDWRIVDEQTARDGVTLGDLYASIHIPASFSADLTSIVEGEPRQAQIDYRVNEKVNAVAPTITETGATTVTQRVNDEVVAETTRALSAELDRLGVRIEEQLPTARRASDALSDLEAALPRLRTAGDLLIAADEQWDAVEEHADRFLALEEAIPPLRTGSEAVLALESRLPEVRQLADELATLGRAADELREALAAVADDDAELAALAEAVDAAREATAAGTDQLDEADALLTELDERLDDADDALEQATADAEDHAEAVSDALERWEPDDEAEEAAKEAVDNALAETAAAVAGAQDGLDALRDEVDAVAALLADGSEAAAAADDALAELDAAVEQAGDRADALADDALAHADDAAVALEQAQALAEDELPAVTARVESAAAVVRDDLPGLEEDYRRAAELLSTHLPTAERAVGELAALAREDLPTVERGVDEASDWAQDVEEEDRLAELVEALRADVDEEAEVVAEPAVLDEEPLFPIPNYGSANVPFYTTLSLWVGALLLANLLRTEPVGPDRRPHHTLRQVYLGRGVLFVAMGLAQGVVASVGNLVLLGAHAQHPALLVAWSALIGAVFTTIVYTLASVLGNIGKALAIVLLVLQLSGGGGTFPIEVTPPFFQAIHPYLPFTYAIDLLREAVGGAIPALVARHMAVLGGFAALAVIVGALLKPLLADRIAETSERSRASRLVE